MPFVRVSRDRRGYDQVYLVHSMTRRGRPPRTRVLYWFRTPPGVKVGREPFDLDVRRRLEAQYPDVAFEWDKLVVTAPAPQEEEPWRERRRIERALKQARRQETQGGEAGAGDLPGPPAEVEAEVAATPTPDLETPVGEALLELPAEVIVAEAALEHARTEGAEPVLRGGDAPKTGTPRRRRRRRGGRDRRHAAVAATDALVPEGASVRVVTAEEPHEQPGEEPSAAPTGGPDETS